MRLGFSKALLWAALSGFLALAWEIVWARVFNFASGSRAPVFGFMLSSYLAGLAIGSLWSRSWQKSGVGWSQVSVLVLRANIAAFVVAPFTAMLAGNAGWQWGLALVALSGAMLGVVFPLVCHRAVESNAESGARLSWLYLANILGSGAGSLLTGFVLMDWLTLHQLSLILLITAAGWALSISPVRSVRFFVLPIAVALITMPAFVSLYERLQYKADYQNGMSFERIVESRHGVITVDTSKAVYGNGAYDGVIETKLEPRSWLVRPYFLPAVTDKLDEVLVIGVASGAWTQILANNPNVKKITAIELSSGYLKIIKSYPEVSSLIGHPKVEIIVDDGRRWLRRNQGRKFDAIVMNTTHHWREFSSALLSREFLTQVKSHLKPHGIAFWNCTQSARAAKTGMEVFPHTMMVINNCLASNAPLSVDKARWEKALREWPGAFTDTNHLQAILEFADRKMLPDAKDAWTWMDRQMMEQQYGDAEAITDDNLGHEYR